VSRVMYVYQRRRICDIRAITHVNTTKVTCRHVHAKVQIPLGPVPRNFLVANFMRKLRGTGSSGIWP